MPKTDTPEQAAAAVVATGGNERAVSLASAVAVLDADLAGKTKVLADALAGAYDPRYFTSVALSQFRRSPGLWAITETVQGRVSFVDCVVQAAQYGLPFLAGRAYLVPFRNKGVLEAQLIVGYQGLVDLVTAPGNGVTFVEASVVYSKDQFDYQKGTGGFLHHRPHRTAGEDGVVDRGRPTDVWARVVYASGQDRFDVMNVTEVEAIRRRSRAGKDGPWVTDWDPMACKTVLRRISKTLRISLRVMELIDREDEWERGGAEVQAPESAQAVLRTRLQERLTKAPEPAPAAEAAPAPEPATEAGSGAPGGDTVEGLWNEAPQVVEKEAGSPAVCGATVAGPQGEQYACTLKPRHGGEVHSDGQHDWPK